MRRTLPMVALALAMLLSLACEPETPVTPSVPESLDLSVTPMADEEAEIAAMVLSRELVAPSWLYDRIRRDLKKIRREFRDSVPAVEITFQSVLRPSSLGMQVDFPVFFDTVSGGGRIFDSLNEVYCLDTMYWQFDDYYRLEFEGRLNPARLVDIYAGIPGEYGVWANAARVGDYPMLLIWPDGKTFKYFFRDAWGDCPLGCMYSEVFYFTSGIDGIAYVGNDRGNPDPPLSWNDTVMMAWDTIFYYNEWFAEPGPSGL